MPNEEPLEERLRIAADKFTDETFARPTKMDYAVIQAAFAKSAQITVDFILETERSKVN